MRSTLTVLLLLTTLLMVAPDICIADETDARLAQKVTYQGGYKRLHEVVSDLSAISGVTIYCGSNSSDWRVRDIPVIVCANDIPLGRLLQAVADCTHVGYYSVRKRSEDEVRRYRLFREKKDADAIPASIEARIQANLAIVNWAWDALVAAAKAPDLERKLRALDPDKLRVDANEVVLVAQTLAVMTTEARTKAFQGEQVSISVAEASEPLKRLVEELAEYAYSRSNGDHSKVAEDAVHLHVKISRGNLNSGASFSFVISPVYRSRGPHVWKSSWASNPVNLAEALQAVGLDLPPKPDTCDFENESSLPGYRALTTDDDWNLPSLQTKVKLDLPEGFFDTPSIPEILAEPFRHYDALRPKRGQVLRALSEASGYTIVCEDFVSHIPLYSPPASIGAEKGTTIAEVLRSIERCIDLTGPLPFGFTWFVNEQNKVLIGWMEDWRKVHHILVPASLLANLRAKQHGSGAELDDLTPLLHLTREQWSIWLDGYPGFLGFHPDEGDVLPGQRTVWQLYDIMNRREKRLAKTESGLSLVGLDPAQVADFLRLERIRHDDSIIITSSYGQTQRSLEKELLANPELMSRLVMRVVRVPLDSWEVRVLRVDESEDEHWDMREGVYRPEPHGPAKHGYRLDIFEWNNEDGFRITSTWHDIPFPLYTPEREAELRKGGTTIWREDPWH